MVNCTKSETPGEMYMSCFLQLARFKVPMAVTVNITIFWDVAPFSVLEIYLCVQELAASQKTVIFFAVSDISLSE
jgi:hypothetical protein